MQAGRQAQHGVGGGGHGVERWQCGAGWRRHVQEIKLYTLPGADRGCLHAGRQVPGNTARGRTVQTADGGQMPQQRRSGVRGRRAVRVFQDAQHGHQRSLGLQVTARSNEEARRKPDLGGAAAERRHPDTRRSL